MLLMVDGSKGPQLDWLPEIDPGSVIQFSLMAEAGIFACTMPPEREIKIAVVQNKTKV
jgi:hypothetical protein